jgi:hypothetical protein
LNPRPSRYEPDEAPSSPTGGLRIPACWRPLFVCDERVGEGDDIGNEIGPALGWVKCKRRPSAQRVVTLLTIGHVSERSSQWLQRVLTMLGDRAQC